ncbi:hypothetical protein Pan97_24980 [Bremerella volcania]|uniref:DUF1559 domain-containing protein n=1 Tax=Bremerella volcania TaxID=2527984 RepID=A0A518C8B0_9BACT|nr:DUF1559 domain-containing protein [Bremerella volcania]QDU75466.1 hypothetical protein Pan97_24980 [Bremerella volcania]
MRQLIATRTCSTGAGRRGFSLVELLVVLGIIGLLLAILIPAVQAVRESGRKLTCQNNLRQIVLGIANHESANGMLPPLYNGTPLAQPRSAMDEFHFHSWRTVLLPHIEQTALYDRCVSELFATDPANQAAINVELATYLCPSANPHNRVVPDIYSPPAADGTLTFQVIGTAARSDYEAIGGYWFKPSGTVDLQNIKFGAWGEPRSYNPLPAKDAYRKARLRDVSDGQSNTILVAERAGRPDWYRKGEPVDVYPYDDPTTGMDHHQAAWGVSTHFWWLVFGHEEGINESNSGGIYSFHAGGANVGLADGSVRFLPESIDQETLNALVTRASGD